MSYLVTSLLRENAATLVIVPSESTGWAFRFRLLQPTILDQKQVRLVFNHDTAMCPGIDFAAECAYSFVYLVLQPGS